MKRKQLAIVILLAFMAVSPAFAQREERGPAPVPQVFAPNMLRLSPLTAMDVGLGFGLSYEHIFGANQRIGVIFPVTLLLENRNTQNIDSGSSSGYNTYVYFTPGVKIYPFGQRKVTYAIGPSLMIGYGGGNERQYHVDLYGNRSLLDVTMTRWRLGMIVNNYVNFQFTERFSLGLEGGLGIRYLDKISYSGSQYYAGNGDFSNGVDISGQFALTLGYRF